MTDSVGDKHVLGVRIAGDSRQFIAVKVRADTDCYQSDAGVSNQLRLTKSRVFVDGRVVGDYDDRLDH